MVEAGRAWTTVQLIQDTRWARISTAKPTIRAKRFSTRGGLTEAQWPGESMDLPNNVNVPVRADELAEGVSALTEG